MLERLKEAFLDFMGEKGTPERRRFLNIVCWSGFAVCVIIMLVWFDWALIWSQITGEPM